MARLSDLHEAGRETALALECPVFEDKPFTPTRPLEQRCVALISSAGLIQRNDPPFRGGDASYRSFSKQDATSDILISHISVNFDRTGAIGNTESIFPRQILEDLATEGTIAASADTHYSFMGATDPAKMQDAATQLAKELQAKSVDTAVFLPV